MIIEEYFLSVLHKTYVVDTHQNRLGEAILTCTHNICFYGEISKIIS